MGFANVTHSGPLTIMAAQIMSGPNEFPTVSTSRAHLPSCRSSSIRKAQPRTRNSSPLPAGISHPVSS
jgi:hypothetical protein